MHDVISDVVEIFKKFICGTEEKFLKVVARSKIYKFFHQFLSEHPKGLSKQIEFKFKELERGEKIYGKLIFMLLSFFSPFAIRGDVEQM